MQATKMFRDEVRAAWGDMQKVAMAGMNEVPRHVDDLGGLDEAGSIRLALHVGTLAGYFANQSPEDFIEAFNRDILMN